MTAPLLSICVPTYNRAAMLRVMLGAVLPQVAAEHGAVELCLSDNASPDETPEVVRAAQAIHPFQHARNETNLGPIRNFHRVTNEMARGEYVWVLGDDDLVRPGAVRRIVAALRDNLDLDAFYVNFRSARFDAHWPAQAPGGYDGPYDFPAQTDFDDRRIEAWEELVSGRNSFCTQLYVHVLRREIWRGLSDGGAFGAPYSSFRWTWPHACMAAKAMFGRPAYYVGEPAVTIFNREVDWSRHTPRMMLDYLPQLVDFFEDLGLPARRAAEFRKIIDALGVSALKRLLRGEGPAADLTPWGYWTKNWDRPRAWRLLGKALWGLWADRRAMRRVGGAPAAVFAAKAPSPILASPPGHGRPVRVCFVAPGAYPLFDPSVHRPIGGIESRSVLFARGLARRSGFDVSFLVDDHGQPADERIDGVRVRVDPAQRRFLEYRESLIARQRQHAKRVRECLPRKTGFPWFRVERLRPRLAWDILAVLGWMLRFRLFPPRGPADRWSIDHPRPQEVYGEIGTDVCLGFGANGITAEMVASCRHYGAKSVVFLASDTNLSTQYVLGSREIDSEGEVAGACHYALANADFLLAQTEQQRRLLRERFGRDAIVVRNPVFLDPGKPMPPAAGREFVLWIGRADRHSKRPELCLALAARCPEIPFVMVMNPRFADVTDEIQREKTPNVRLIERVPADEMPDYYRRARALVNTSNLEGFPNTFLEAGKHGAPVLSLEVDPDGMLSDQGCGLFAGGDLDRLAEQLRRVWRDDEVADRLARRMNEYLRAHHEAQARIEELAEALRRIAAGEAMDRPSSTGAERCAA